jgi:predicted DNA-binding transcriptional regulator AlpA
MMKRIATTLARLGVAELEQRLNVDRSTIWRWYKAGRFPVPHFLVDNRRAWFLHEVEAWERDQMARPAAVRRCNLGERAQAREPQP